MPLETMHLFDTTPRWLGLTYASTVCVLVLAGVGLFTSGLFTISITPFTILAHFAVAICVSAWVLNFRIKLAPERKALLALGLVIAVGSLWTSVQQWFGYVQSGVATDLTLVAAAMAMDAAGGCFTYILFQLNRIRKQNPVSKVAV